MRNRFPIALGLALACAGAARAQNDVIPHAQDRPPGPALSPSEAIAKMTVPEGFTVEVVASEPDIVNPVSMTFDEKGRVWITESLEYPRQSAGPGRDRVKILEDTDGDGKADKFSIFAEGLNIPSGIAVGHGGVWVANSPDILFYPDADRDGKADGPPQVVVSGFGRDDTHELPNSLTWGPDGWLYGWNGVFNQSHIVHRGQRFDFTCAIWRIHPKTREFNLFCEGTSNPWGLAINDNGDFFASACVIDHLWHLAETGYYIRQGGPYPPYTWPIPSIVDHKHQKAAYCGIHYFDSPSFPEKYRDQLYMGNIHGNAINKDKLERKGSTYRDIETPDFLDANDAWFMPVVQKTGPDGSLYILDWYDRYHCYQDANRDPAGIDRLKGRLYRVRYGKTPRRSGFDMGKESDEGLVALLASPNVYDRDIAQRLLTERNHESSRGRLQDLVLNDQAPRKARMHALWALVGGGPLATDFHVRLFSQADANVRAWAVRAAGNMEKVDPEVARLVQALASDPSRDVQLQVTVAARKIEGLDAVALLTAVLSQCGDDPLIPHIVWQNLLPLMDARSDDIIARLEPATLRKRPNVAGMFPLLVDRLLGRKDGDPRAIVSLVSSLAKADPDAAGGVLAALARRVQDGEIAGDRLKALRERIEPALDDFRKQSPQGSLGIEANLLAASWKEARALEVARATLRDSRQSEDRRVRGLQALVAAGDDSILDGVTRALADPGASSIGFRGRLLASLGRLDDPRVAPVVLAAYPRLEPELKPRAVELLTDRPAWSLALLKAVEGKGVPTSALNINQLRKLQNTKDAEVAARVKALFGTVREGRNPQRELVVGQMRNFLRKSSGNAVAGQAIFNKLCAQCHKIYGEGQDVGPDITSNGRNDFDQMISNVFDPSLVIGSAYQATTVATKDGRVLTGLLAEDGPERIVLKLQGGKAETIPRGDVEEKKISDVSLMPEDVEKQLNAREIADLFAFLALDKPPSDPSAKLLPGAPNPSAVVDRFAPGWVTAGVGEDGPDIMADYRDRKNVLRTHPLSEGEPCVLRRRVDVPAGKTTTLKLSVTHDPRGDWQLVVKADGQVLLDRAVGPKTTRDGWLDVDVDLSPFAGRAVVLELENRASNWSWEHAYWGRIEVASVPK